MSNIFFSIIEPFCIDISLTQHISYLFSTAISSGPILRTVYVDMDLPPVTLDMIQPILEVNEPFSKSNKVHHSDKDGKLTNSIGLIRIIRTVSLQMHID